jgi:hypothetical protein
VPLVEEECKDPPPRVTQLVFCALHLLSFVYPLQAFAFLENIRVAW